MPRLYPYGNNRNWTAQYGHEILGCMNYKCLDQKQLHIHDARLAEAKWPTRSASTKLAELVRVMQEIKRVILTENDPKIGARIDYMGIVEIENVELRDDGLHCDVITKNDKYCGGGNSNRRTRD